nr:venom protease-like isoform X1 [Leptinotarsa decemlineata]
MWLKSVTILLILHWTEVLGNKSSIIDNHPSWKCLPKDTCGMTRFDVAKGRIIGGEKAALGQFPWMVRIGFARFTLMEPEFFCAGSLISTTHVLTAGHCGTKNNMVRVGENNVETNPDCEGNVCAPRPQDIRIKLYLIDIYDSETSQDDINMILLAKHVKLNDFVVPICLPYGGLLKRNMMGKHMTIAGWGYTSSSSENQSKDLMHVAEPVVNQTLCNDIYKHNLTSKQYCIGYPEGKDTCNGDSGGPAMKSMKVNDGRRMFLFGIVSYGLVDCGNGPAVYTAVVKYMKIILDKIQCQ